MPWESLPLEVAFAETATLSQNGIALSAKFMESQNLLEYEWVEVFTDDILRRIGLKFHNNQTPKTRKLIRSRGTGGRRITAKKLPERKWIADVLNEPISDRRFSIETDDSVEDPTDGVRYYISIGYRLQPKREFGKQGDYPRLPGIYRFFKDGEIVRIGESDNLESRLKDHYRNYKDEVDEYDFAEIPDLTARKREEKRLLQEFRDAYGRLPKLNPVAT